MRGLMAGSFMPANDGFWPLADMPSPAGNVRFRCISGHMIHASLRLRFCLLARNIPKFAGWLAEANVRSGTGRSTTQSDDVVGLSTHSAFAGFLVLGAYIGLAPK